MPVWLPAVAVVVLVVALLIGGGAPQAPVQGIPDPGPVTGWGLPLLRLATALEVTIPDLLRGDGRAREDEIAGLAADPFVAEVAPYIFSLDAMQRSSLMMQMRDLATRPRRKI